MAGTTSTIELQVDDAILDAMEILSLGNFSSPGDMATELIERGVQEAHKTLGGDARKSLDTKLAAIASMRKQSAAREPGEV